MSTFARCDESVEEMARALISEFDTHKPLIEHEVKIDYVFAFATTDEQGFPKGDALRKNGLKALGLTRILSLKDRAMGRGDVEIALDGDWWTNAPLAEKRALLDHELHHIMPLLVDRDDLGRPRIKLRKHDVEFGWFRCIAARHGENSLERQQARQLMEDSGQYFWGDIAGIDFTPAKPEDDPVITFQVGNKPPIVAKESVMKAVLAVVKGKKKEAA